MAECSMAELGDQDISRTADSSTAESFTWIESLQLTLTEVLNDPAYAISSPRILLAKECAGILVDKLGDAAVVSFAEEVGGELVVLLQSSLATPSKTFSKRREKMWTSFYRFRASGLIKSWSKLVVELSLPQKYINDPWLVQVMSRILLKRAIKYCLPSTSRIVCDKVSETITLDEHNALRYAVGYIMRSLKKKYSKTDPSIVAWIQQMVDTTNHTLDEEATSFLQFTKLWVERVNRGGLFLVNDSLYEVFVSMEVVLRKFLNNISVDDNRLDTEKVYSLLHEDNEIQFHWSMLTFDLDDEVSQSVFDDMLRLFITIRGFAYASAIVDDYKRTCGLANKRKKALRKELKKSSDK